MRSVPDSARATDIPVCVSEILPKGWKMTTIGQVVLKKVDQDIPSGTGTIRYIDIGSIDNSAKHITEARTIPALTAPSRARQKVAGGDVLVSMTRPNLNAVAVVPSNLVGAIASTGFDVLRPTAGVLSEWLFLIVCSQRFVGAMTTLVQGALYPAVRPSDIRDFPIPLPPLPEQRRIVARLEALTARSRRARALLAEVPKQLAQARQSLLASAFRGDLTADWRGKGENKLNDAISFDGHTLPRIPLNWRWETVEALATTMRIGLVRSASEQTTNSGVSYIRMQHYDLTGRWHLEDVTRVNVSKEELANYALTKGDILFNTRNSQELVGKVGIWTGHQEPHVFNVMLRSACGRPKIFTAGISASPRAESQVLRRATRARLHPG